MGKTSWILFWKMNIHQMRHNDEVTGSSSRGQSSFSLFCAMIGSISVCFVQDNFSGSILGPAPIKTLLFKCVEENI